MPPIMELKNGAGWTNPAPQRGQLARRSAMDWGGVRFGAPCVGWVDRDDDPVDLAGLLRSQELRRLVEQLRLDGTL